MTFQEHSDIINSLEISRREIRDSLYDQYVSEGKIWGAIPREHIRQIRFDQIPTEKLDILRKYADSSMISDILDTFGIHGAISASQLIPVLSRKTVVGQAITFKNLPERKEVIKGYQDKDFIGMSTKDIAFLGGKDNILVIDTCGLTDVSSFGGMAAKTYASKGIEGAIVWGAVRDIKSISESGFPVWSKGKTCKTGKYRIQAVEMNGPVAISDVLVCPGDIIIADDSGVCVIPPEIFNEVLEKVISSAKAEKNMENLIGSGGSIDAIRAADRPQYQ